MNKVVKNDILQVIKLVIGRWQYFMLISKKQESNLKSLYKNLQTTGIKTFNGCVFMANGMVNHGGLCDRLKGILSLYYWCRCHNVEFRIYFTSPFILEDYLNHNEYDWHIGDEEISYDLSDSQPIHHMYTNVVTDLVNSGKASVWTEKYFDRRLSSIHKKQIHLFSNALTKSAMSVSSMLFKELFRPSDKLQKQIDFHKSEIGGDYISISFRFTTLLGDFIDCTGLPALDEETAREYIDTCIASIDEISQKATSHNKILVTSDSSRFLSKLEDRGDIYIIPGVIGHTQYQSDTDATMKTFLDFMMIADANEVYLVKYKEMYYSGFAKTAAMINDRPFSVYSPQY